MKFKTYPAFDHQHDEWKLHRATELRGLLWEQGVGKSRTVLDQSAWLYLQDRLIDGLLILAPNGVHENWITDEIPVHLIEDVPWDGDSYYTSKSKTKRHKARMQEIINYEGLAILAMSYDAFMTKQGKATVDEFLAKRKTFYVCDECFPAGTLVDTPNGPVPIEGIKAGDEILSCNGISHVHGAWKRKVTKAVRIKVGKREIVCSENHPFFTRRGWVPAVELEVGDECIRTCEAMRLVQRHPGDRSKSSILRKILLREMENEPAGNKGESLHSGEIEKNVRSPKGQRHALDPVAPASFDEGAQNCHIKSKERETVSCCKGREREGNDGASGDSSQTTREGLGSRTVCVAREEQKGRSPHLLQDRRCTSRAHDSRRSGRPRAQEQERNRREKRQNTEAARVESIEVLELGRDGRFGEDGQYDPWFYDLEIEGHPSYSVEGLLVHNSQRIKTPGAKRTRSVVYSGRRATYKRILTGTPVTNSPFDIYSQIKFLDEHFWKKNGFASYEAFKTHFGIWEARINNKTGGRFNQVVAFKNLDQLSEIVATICSRVTKEEALDLPPKIYTKRYFNLSAEQRRIYKGLKEDFMVFLDNGDMITAPLVITQMLRLQQVTCGYVPSDDCEKLHHLPENPRLKLLLDTLSDVEGQAIIFARFRQDIDQICRELGEHAVRYDGAVKGPARAEARKRFQAGGVRFFVGNPAAAGTGLTLHAAKTVIYYSNSFNLEHRLQSEDRAHRIGQNHSVRYIDLVAQGTLDSYIVSALRRKLNIASQITGDKIREWL